MTIKPIVFATSVFSFSTASIAVPVTLDFEAPSLAGQYFLDGELFIDNTVQVGTTGANGAVSILNPGAAYSTGPVNGSAYVQSSVGSSVYIAATGNDVFTLLALDLGEYSQYANTSSVTITGFKQDGSQVSGSLPLDNIFDGLGGAADFQAYQFDASWSGLTRVEFDSSAYSLDNIQLNIAAVPLPAAVWLFASGAIGLLALRKNSQKTRL